jgi:hypothetical protein
VASDDISGSPLIGQHFCYNILFAYARVRKMAGGMQAKQAEVGKGGVSVVVKD